MAIPEEEARRVAELAALGLGDDEAGDLAKDLTRILDYFDILRRIEIPEGTEEAHRRDATPLRPDDPGDCLGNEEATRNAPQVANGLFRVPRVIG